MMLNPDSPPKFNGCVFRGRPYLLTIRTELRKYLWENRRQLGGERDINTEYPAWWPQIDYQSDQGVIVYEFVASIPLCHYQGIKMEVIIVLHHSVDGLWKIILHWAPHGWPLQNTPLTAEDEAAWVLMTHIVSLPYELQSRID